MKRKYLLTLFILTISITIAHSDKGNTSSKLSYFINEIKNIQYDGLESIAMYDSIVKLYSLRGDTINIVKYMIEKGMAQSINSNHISSYKTFDTVLSILNSMRNTNVNRKYKSKALLSLAKESRRLGMYDDSVEKCFELLTNNNNEDVNQTIIANSLLSIVFMTMNNEQAAEEYSNKAYDLYKKNNNLENETHVTLWNCIAGIQYFSGRYDSSIQYLNKTFEYINDNESPTTYRNIINNNMANTYFAMGEYDIAKRNYEKILESLHDKPNSFYKSETLLNIANTYYMLKDYGNAKKYYDRSISMAQSVKAYSIKAMAQIQLSSLLFDTQNYRLSRIYLEHGQTLWDSISDVDNIAKLDILKSNFENKELKKDKEILEKELQILLLSNKNKGTLLFAIFLLLILSTSAIVIMIKKIQHHNRNNQQLTTAIDNLQQNKKEVVESVIQKYDTEIDIKNDRLKTLAQVIIKSHDIIDKIMLMTKEILQQDNASQAQTKIKELQAIINSHKNDRIWCDFELYFEQQHNNFHEQIRKFHPDLTPNEMQMCTLLIIDMNAKDIATFTNKSVRTVESTLYRTRKKLNIPPDIKTSSYLKKFV